MYSLLRQVFVAILGGVVAAGVMLAVNHYRPGPNIALAQTSITEVPANSPEGPEVVDTPNVDATKMINYQGQVFNPNTGQPYVSAALNMTFSFWDAATGGSQVYTEDRNIQTNADGFFSTNIGDTTNFNNNAYGVFNGQARYLQVTILGQVLGPRQPLTFVPFSMWAYHAKHLDDYEADDFPKIIAHGVVNADGGKASGDNFSSSRGNVAGSTVYIIDVEDIDHSINNFTTIVTPACDAPVMTGVGSSNGDLVINVFDPNGSRTTCRFEFMVLQK